MKRLVYILSAIVFIASFVSCQKQIEITVAPEQKISFEATMPDITKTSIDKELNVLWSEGDKIDVYGCTDNAFAAKAVFELSSGAGTKNGKFTLKEGETFGTYDSYVAIYPSGYALKTSSLPATIEIASNISTYTSQAVVENGYDPAHAIMTATVSGGKLVFRHGVSYFRIQIPDDGITKVKIVAASNAFQKRPAYSAENGSITANNSGSNEMGSVEGSFKKGSYYYFCAVPRTADSQKLNGITITYTHNGVDKPVSTTVNAVKNLFPYVGYAYDLGCPPLITPAPVITANGVDIKKDDTSGKIEFSIANSVTGGVLSAATTEGKVNTISDFVLGEVSNGTIPFTCSANTEASVRYAYVTLTYTYDTDKTVTKNIVVSQASAGGGASATTYFYYINNDGTETNTNDKFSGTLSNGLVSFSASDSSGCGADSFTVESLTVTKGLKFNGNGAVSFTTSSTLNSKLTFYYVARKSGDNSAARIKLTPSGGTETVYNNFNTYGTVSSQVDVALEKGTTYTIARDNKELALVLVKLVESSN